MDHEVISMEKEIDNDILNVSPIARAVLEQLGGISHESIKDAIAAAKFGGDGGFYGFIFYEDIRQFVDENAALIRRCLKDDYSRFTSSCLRFQSPLLQGLLKGVLRSLRRQKVASTMKDFCSYIGRGVWTWYRYGKGDDVTKSLIAWYILERVGYELLTTL